MTMKTRDRMGSVLILAFVAALWAQRNYMTRFGGIFPDIVMEIMAVILVVTLILSFTPYAAMKEEEKDGGGGKIDRKGMVVVGGILFAWAVLLRYLGFVVTGLAGFTSIAWYLAGLPLDGKVIGRCALIAAFVTFLLVLVFQRMLQVPLPPGTLFG